MIKPIRPLALFLLLLSLPSAALAQQQQYPGAEWNKPFKPFRIVGNIYYVGTNDLACYLITTPSGHILLDTALEQSHDIVKGNIESLGFKLKDIKIMISSHAHFDHVAGHADMKAATGARVFASAADAVVLESGGKKGFYPLGDYKPVKVDHILKDGETITLGNTKMTAHLAPGHTEGNTGWTMVVTDNDKKYDVVFVPSMSINDGVHLVNFKPWPGVADAYAQSFAMLKQLHCDVFLGPHARFFDMENKAHKLETNPTTNPFIDPAGYQQYIASFEQAYKEQLTREKQPN
ncbi:MAG TPA: subclass B3 metallo-beta-lactamase [Pyrinomonadaceae bacterium]